MKDAITLEELKEIEKELEEKHEEQRIRRWFDAMARTGLKLEGVRYVIRRIEERAGATK